MEALLKLNQAGDKLGVESEALSRLIQMGALPEARHVEDGDEMAWVIPAAKLPNIAARNGWTIDLRTSLSDGAITATSPRKTTEAESTQPQTIPLAERGNGGQFVTAKPRTGDTQPVARIRQVDVPSNQGSGDRSSTEQALRPKVDFENAKKVTVETVQIEKPMGSIVLRSTADKASAIEATTDKASAIEATAGEASAVVAGSATEEQSALAAPSVSDVIDLELLDRLLGAQEDKAIARAEVEHSKLALASLNETHTRVTSELEVERRERMVASERFRTEQLSRVESEAKVAELRDRVAREMALAEAEKAARAEALNRASEAEREAAEAFAAMTWRSRRRYRRMQQP